MAAGVSGARQQHGKMISAYSKTYEIAHCVHDDHDNDFKALWALLKMEYAQHRARNAQGQSAAVAQRIYTVGCNLLSTQSVSQHTHSST